MARIRVARRDEAGAIAAIYEPIVRDTVVTFEAVPPTAEEMAARMDAVLAYAPWLVYEDDGRVCGYAYASRHHVRAAYQWSVDVSVYIDARYRRRGVGRALYTSLLELLRLQGFHAAHASITMGNEGSIAIHEAFGFRNIGVFPAVGFKHGAWHDVGWWQLRLRELVAEPKPPRLWPEMRETPEAHAVMRG